jgi:hypothetical protein
MIQRRQERRIRKPWSISVTTEISRDSQPDAGPDPLGPDPLDPALLQAIRLSATRMAAAEESFVRLLHEDIRHLLRQLPDHGWGCCERIARTVLWLALSDQSAEQAIEASQWLGETNQADGFPQSEYVSIGHALVRVAREISGGNWTTTTGSAWIRFFLWLQPHLQAGARQQAADEEVARRQAAADHEAARRTAFDQATGRGTADPDVSAIANLLADEDEDEAAPGYDQIMLGMTTRRDE